MVNYLMRNPGTENGTNGRFVKKYGALGMCLGARGGFG